MRDRMAGKLVAYRRVSTQKQRRIGLGLEAQDDLIHGFGARTRSTIVGEFVEVETGKNSDRTELRKAMRVVTVIDSGPIKIIDSSRQYRWRADRSVPFVGNGTVLPVAQRRRCQPPGVRRTWPPRSSESSALPNRSLLTASASRSRVRVNTAP
jgi:hypothetical protein